MRFLRRIFRGAIDRLNRVRLGSVGYARAIGVQVGEGCRIGIWDFGTEPYLIKIGNRVTIAPNVQIYTHDGSSWLVRDPDDSRHHIVAPVSIGDNVFIGAGSIILPGVTIGSRVVVGAGSVVTKDVDDNTVVAGVPARVLGSFEEFQSKVRARGFHEREFDLSLPERERVTRVVQRQQASKGCCVCRSDSDE